MPLPLTPLAQPGDLVAGKYRIERMVAVGGMGVVMAARHEDLGQPVAIKLLRQESLSNAEAVARFLREARTAARLSGEHICRVFDVGTTGEGIPFMVMEYLNGQDLQQVLEREGPLPVRDAVTYVLQTLEAVAEAHAAGVIHRDLKPSNLFLSTRSDGSRSIKVLDFGISRGQGLDAPTDGQPLTHTRQVMGSPGYMSPEQMTRPRTVDGRSDIWSIGVVLYALLTGEQPFLGETVAAVMASILHEPVPKVRAKRSEVPAGLERVIERCLNRDLSARFTSVAQVARALASFGPEHAKLSVERVESVLAAASPAGLTLLRMAETKTDDSEALPSAAWSGAVLSDRSRKRVLVVLGAAGALAAALAVGVWLGGRQPRGTEAAFGNEVATDKAASGQGEEAEARPAHAGGVRGDSAPGMESATDDAPPRAGVPTVPEPEREVADGAEPTTQRGSAAGGATDDSVQGSPTKEPLAGEKGPGEGVVVGVGSAAPGTTTAAPALGPSTSSTPSAPQLTAPGTTAVKPPGAGSTSTKRPVTAPKNEAEFLMERK
ncbi:serine/threonine-protein kinase [Chondromyces crocatus]|uniref:Protein kinase n=1 Tax=Chondromyces crocatus TaxID=52 RepID=A0A0K1EJY7_CHOCO|nr:serine/threonine-protein kinase [Chondromyces crocatus]AKT40913.1 protein kinase [Chondromyces crocatus]